MNAMELSAKAMRSVMPGALIVMIDRALKESNEALEVGRTRIIFSFTKEESDYEERFCAYMKSQMFDVFRGDGIFSFPVVPKGKLVIQW